jgi:(p)ppGpp synthase/HD superfamily hydrolase
MRLYTSETAARFAFKKHDEVNQKYGGYLPYSYHLSLAAAIANKYISLIPEIDRDFVMSAVYLHDVLEDTHTSYNDLADAFDTELAEVVYALTNLKGRNRKERANEVYYQGIRDTKYAVFVKLADRLANVLYSSMFTSRMFEMYKNENQNFKAKLYDSYYCELFDDLDNLFETKAFGFEPIDERGVGF